MRNIFVSLQNMFVTREEQEQQKEQRSVEPEVITAIAVDLRDLAARAAQFCHDSSGTAIRLKNLEAELKRLEVLANRPEFCKLSVEQRLELRQGLLHVRDQILNTMQKEQTPTDIVQ